MPSLGSPLQRRFYGGLIDRYDRRFLGKVAPYPTEVYLQRMTHKSDAGIAQIMAAVGPITFTALDISAKSGTFTLTAPSSIRAGTIKAIDVVIDVPCASAEPTIKITLGVDPSGTDLWGGQPLASMQAAAGTKLAGAPVGAPFPHTVAAASRLRGTVTPAAAVYTAGKLTITIHYDS